MKKKAPIQLSDHFTYGKLLRFTFPSVIMMLFTSIYGVVDGFYISNIVGETAFAAINLILPYCMIFSAVGSLFGVGGSALVAMTLGLGQREKANRIFSLLIYTIIATGVVFAVLSEIFLPAAIRSLGATEAMERTCLIYGRIFMSALPVFLLQFGFQSFLITAERPRLGLAFTIAAGVSNMILDWLFIAVFRWGAAGAAAASCLGQCIGGIGPLLFFCFSKSSVLRLGRTSFMPRALLRSASNGAAECITNFAMSFVGIVFNWQLMKYLGEFGVSAYGIILYVNFVFVAVYLGYSMGVMPVFSFHHGAENTDELKSLFRKSMTIMLTASAALTALAIVTARSAAGVFAGYDETFLALSTRALRLYSLSYFLAGFNIFGGNLFTAFNNGRIAGTLSVLRMFVFQLLAVLLLPLVLGSDGIWLSMLAAESGVFMITLYTLIRQRKRYHYA